MNKKIIRIMSVITLLLLMFTTQIFARDNTALSVGSIYDSNIDTKQMVANASQYYSTAGYKSYYGYDLDKNTLYSYLYADVQFFAGHGSSNHIEFSTTGIVTGNDLVYEGKQYIGTNTVHWDADTILVTYLGCNTAQDSDWSTIAGETCNRGANTVVGFNKKININSANSWADRYNEKLKDGYTVYDAARYANSFIYLYPNIKQLTIFGDTNLTIGGTNTTSNLQNNRDYNDKNATIYNIDNKIEKNNISLDDALVIIKEKSGDNDLVNYEIVRNDGITKIKKNQAYPDEQEEYVDVILKLGEFYTDVGYTIYLKNNIVQKIYDNHAITDKEVNIILSNDNIKNTNVSGAIEKLLKAKAIKETKLKYNDSKLEIDYSETNTKLYYDLKENKKYMVVEVKSTMKNGITDNETEAYDAVFYEI